MTKPVALVTARVDRSSLEVVRSDWDLRIPRADDGVYTPYAAGELVELLDGCTAWVTEIDVASEPVIAAAPTLALIVSCRGNPVNVDLDAASRSGVLVCNVPGRNADATADLAVGLMLCAVRQIVAGDRWIREGLWSGEANLVPYRRFEGFDLRGARVGLIGFGAVGGRVALRCRAFGMEVDYYDPSPAQTFSWAVPHASVTAALDGADVVSLHAPLNAATVGMIGEAELAVMKRGAILVNAARAALVDRQALFSALVDGQVSVAALDVFWHEPIPSDDPFLALGDRVVMTPHIGGASRDVVRNHSIAAACCLSAFNAGLRPPNLVNDAAMAGQQRQEGT